MRRSHSPRRVLAALSASALLLALTACGSDDSASDEVVGASSSTGASESADPGESADTQPAEGEEVDPQAFVDRLRTAMEGVTTVQLAMTMDTSGMTVQADGAMDYTTDPPSMAISMEMPALGDQPMDMRIVDGTVYMNMGALSQGKFWKLDPSDKSGPLGDLSSLTDSMDPAKSFDNYADGFQKVVFVGEEEVDGETLAHFAVTIDSGKLGAGVGDARMPKTLEYDLWLDDQDRTRRTLMNMGDSGTVDVTMFGYDEPVDIEAPSADQIARMPLGMAGA